jgi:hypothetical protein
MAKDVTGILLPQGQLDEDAIRQAVAARGYGDVLVRVAPLASVKLTQVEVHDAREGLPCEDPELVALLSRGGRAAFVHVNHSAKQAVVHAFSDGKAEEGFAGEPGTQFTDKLKAAIGVDGGIDAVTSADDGSRIGIGVAASRTIAVIRGVPLLVPPGTPTDFDSFRFHDRGDGAEEVDEDPEARERMAILAFDPRLQRLLYGMPGNELAANLQTVPAGYFGPLEALRADAIAKAASLGEKSFEAGSAGGVNDVRVLELCTLLAASAFSSGDQLGYWDQRVLPMFALAPGEPRIDPDEVEDLDDCAGVAHAMVEVLPYASPPSGEGSLLASISDDELAPLAPWAKPGEEYAGSMLQVKRDRLLALVRGLDGNQLRARIAGFERAWYRAARPGMPEGDAFETWRRVLAEQGQADLQRFVKDWTELRIVLEIAAINPLETALFFYEGA